MKKLFLLLIFFLPYIINAQVAINTTGATPDGSSMLDVSSTSAGMLVPRMTEAQRDAISSPATGLLIYQTDNTAGFYYWDGSAWTKVGSSGSLSGSGTNNYVARWTPDGNTLGTGIILDNGSGVSINASGSTADADAILDISSTTKGIFIPRMNNTQRENLGAPDKGLILYQINDDDAREGILYYDDMWWNEVIVLREDRWTAANLCDVPYFDSDHNQLVPGNITDWGGIISLTPESSKANCYARVDITNTDPNFACDLIPPYKALEVEQGVNYYRESWVALFENTNTTNSGIQENKNGIEIKVTGGGSNTPAQYALKTTTSGDAQNNFGANINVSGASGYNMGANITAKGGTHNWPIWATTDTEPDPSLTAMSGDHGAYIEGDLWINKIKVVDATALPYSLANDDFYIYTNGTGTITVPAASGREGKIYIIKSISGGTPTLSTSTSILFVGTNGNTTYTMSNGEIVRIISNGTHWFEF